MSGELLPGNATSWEIAVANAMDDQQALGAPIVRIRGAKLVNPDPAFVPFLLFEYGLGELTPYVLDHYRLIQEGVRWQRLRGTAAAVYIGLSWLSLTAAIKEARADRAFWNSFQLYFTTLPAADSPDLDRVENVAALSVPLRSKLRRGVYYYDVPMMVLGRNRLGRSILGTDSGTALKPEGVRWSFGRNHEFKHLLSEAEGTSLGNWVAPASSANPTWDDMDFPWTLASFPWVADGPAQREAAMAAWFAGRTTFLALYDEQGEVIGYRRCRATAAVNKSAAGAYSFGDGQYAPVAGGRMVYIEALTGFGDASDVRAASVALVFGGTVIGRPGQLWLEPEQLSGGTVIATA
ncbi:MAG TPA: phage tail protein, partial [Devosia sp.]|nr:phage tail protein [Devosia sp.]